MTAETDRRRFGPMESLPRLAALYRPGAAVPKVTCCCGYVNQTAGGAGGAAFVTLQLPAVALFPVFMLNKLALSWITAPLTDMRLVSIQAFKYARKTLSNKKNLC